jgi:eukaryotic-like serine/threonine-protein kinase
MIRLAHERVLTSWRRARKIAETHRAFYRIRTDVEHEYRRWMEGGQRSEFLLAAGTPLLNAERIVRDYGDELPVPLKKYVASSGRRARLRHGARKPRH